VHCSTLSVLESVAGAPRCQFEASLIDDSVAGDTKGGHALVALTVDSAIPAQLLDEITWAIGAASGRAVDLVD